MKRRISTRLFWGVTVVAALVVLGLLAGAFDRFSPDGRVERPAIGAVATYWALASVAIGLFAFAPRYWRELALLVVSLSVVGLVSEAAVRHWFPHRSMMRLTVIASELYHHVFPRNRTMSGGIYDGVAVVVTTNDDGLRSAYTRDSYLRHRHRIAFLGDSFTFGFGAPPERTFPQVVEGRLRDKLGDDLAVLNGGIVSYSPFLARCLFDGIIRHYRPQLVFYVLDPSDIGDDVKYMNEAVESDEGIRFPLLGSREANYHGGLFEIARPLLAPLRAFIAYPFAVLREGPWRFRVDIDGVVETNRFFIYRHPLDKTRVYFERTMENVRLLAEQCREHGARLVLVVSPRYNHWNPADCPHDWESEAGYYSLDDPYQFEYFKFFEEKGASPTYDVLHLLPFFQASRDSSLVFDNDLHWNERGHRLVAGVLTDFVIDHDLVGGLPPVDY